MVISANIKKRAAILTIWPKTKTLSSLVSSKKGVLFVTYR